MAKVFGMMSDLLRVLIAGQSLIQSVPQESGSSSNFYKIGLEVGNSPSASLTPSSESTYPVINQERNQDLSISSSVTGEQQVFINQFSSELDFEFSKNKGVNKTICISNIVIKGSDTETLYDDTVIPIGDLSSLCGRDWSWGMLHDGTRQRCIRLDSRSDESNKADGSLHLDMDHLSQILSESEDLRKTDLETACKIFGSDTSPKLSHGSYKMSFSQGINSLFGIDTISLVNITSADFMTRQSPYESMNDSKFWVADNRLLDSQSQGESEIAVAQILNSARLFGLEVKVSKSIPIAENEESKYKPRISSRIFAMRVQDFEAKSSEQPCLEEILEEQLPGEQYLDRETLAENEIFGQQDFEAERDSWEEQLLTDENSDEEDLYLSQDQLIEELLEDELLAEPDLSAEEQSLEEEYIMEGMLKQGQVIEPELLKEELLDEEGIILEEKLLAEQELAAERELIEEEMDAEEELFIDEIDAEEALLQEQKFLTDEQLLVKQEILEEAERAAEEELAEEERRAEEQLLINERVAEQELFEKKPSSEKMFSLEMLEKKKALEQRPYSESSASLEEEDGPEDEEWVETSTEGILTDLDDELVEVDRLTDEALFEEDQSLEQALLSETLSMDEPKPADEIFVAEVITLESAPQNDFAEQLSNEEILSENNQPNENEFYSTEPYLEYMSTDNDFTGEMTEIRLPEELFPEEMFTFEMPGDEELYDFASFPEQENEEILAEMLQGLMIEENLPSEPLEWEPEMGENPLNSELRK